MSICSSLASGDEIICDWIIGSGWIFIDDSSIGKLIVVEEIDGLRILSAISLIAVIISSKIGIGLINWEIF